MSVDYNLNVINTRLQDVVTAMDVGGAPGRLILMDEFGTMLAQFVLARPSGTVSNGLLNFNGLTLIERFTDGTGECVQAMIANATGVPVITGLTVSAGSSTDITLTPTNMISAGQTIALQQASITGQ